MRESRGHDTPVHTGQESTSKRGLPRERDERKCGGITIAKFRITNRLGTTTVIISVIQLDQRGGIKSLKLDFVDPTNMNIGMN